MRLPRFRLKLWMLMAATAAVATGLYVRVYHLGFESEIVDSGRYCFTFVPMDSDTGEVLRDVLLTYWPRKAPDNVGQDWFHSDSDGIDAYMVQYVRRASNGYVEYFYADLNGPNQGVSTEYGLEFQADGYATLKTTLSKLVGERIRFKEVLRKPPWFRDQFAPSRDTYRVYLHRTTRPADGPSSSSG